MKRIFIFLCSLLLVCSLCACQEAAPTSSKTPDQQELIDNATAYFNQMLEGNFDTLYSELLLPKLCKPTGAKKLKKLEGCQKMQSRIYHVMFQKKANKTVWNLLSPVKKEISKCLSTIPQMAAYTIM